MERHKAKINPNFTLFRNDAPHKQIATGCKRAAGRQE
jgi:hypothetical protein